MSSIVVKAPEADPQAEIDARGIGIDNVVLVMSVTLFLFLDGKLRAVVRLRMRACHSRSLSLLMLGGFI